MNARFDAISFTWLGCLSLMMAGTTAAAEEPAAKVPEVSVARPVVREVTDYEVFSGRTEAASRIDLRSRVSGHLLKAPFIEGADVKKGDVLFEIDPRPYRAALDKTEATFDLAEARLKLAEANHKRAAALHARGAISAEEFHKIAADRVEAEAGVRLAKAGREAARLDIEFTRVLAPIDGQIGRRLIDPGNLVKADETRLAVLVSREPMHIHFDMDERSLLRLLRSLPGRKVEKTSVDVALAEDNGFPHRGVVDFIDNQLDAATGTVRLRAVIANKRRKLTPGMFVRLRLALVAPHKALLIPERAVMVEDGERTVFVVNDNDVIQARPVKLGQQHDGLRMVSGELTPEDRVVINGLQRLRSGMKVRPRLEALPAKQPESSPDEAGGSAASLPRGLAGHSMLVEADYPGASAEVVSETVREPIEQMVGGIEKLRRLRSRCTSDGKLTIALTFTRGADRQRAQGATQNRLNQALPMLPDVVKRAGVRVTQGTAGVPLILNLHSPDEKRDSLYLGNYARIQLLDQLTRLAGVGEAKLLGDCPHALRIWLDPAKLAERELDVGEVNRLLAKDKNVGEVDPDHLGNLILKANGEGRVIRLRDVARVELGAGGRRSEALLDGKPSIAIVIYPSGENPQALAVALQERLAELRKCLPDGLALDDCFDFSAKAEYLLLDLDLPLAAGAEPVRKALHRCDELLRQAPGVALVLALSENPFDLFGSGPCVLVRLAPAERRKTDMARIIHSIRTRLAALEHATVRIRDLSGGRPLLAFGYPIDLALDGLEATRVRDWAKELGERLGRSKKLTDVRVNNESIPRTHWVADLDREAAAKRGVSPLAVLHALQLCLGAQDVGDFKRYGRQWRVEVQADIRPKVLEQGLRQLKVRASSGQMIPLTAVVQLRETAAPLALHFLNGRPMVQITANLATGVVLEQSRKDCEAAAEEARKNLGLGTAYRLTWLQDR